jgi:hypothetical protein
MKTLAIRHEPEIKGGLKALKDKLKDHILRKAYPEIKGIRQHQ